MAKHNRGTGAPAQAEQQQRGGHNMVQGRAMKRALGSDDQGAPRRHGLVVPTPPNQMPGTGPRIVFAGRNVSASHISLAMEAEVAALVAAGMPRLGAEDKVWQSRTTKPRPAGFGADEIKRGRLGVLVGRLMPSKRPT